MTTLEIILFVAVVVAVMVIIILLHERDSWRASGKRKEFERDRISANYDAILAQSLGQQIKATRDHRHLQYTRAQLLKSLRGIERTLRRINAERSE